MTDPQVTQADIMKARVVVSECQPEARCPACDIGLSGVDCTCLQILALENLIALALAKARQQAGAEMQAAVLKILDTEAPCDCCVMTIDEEGATHHAEGCTIERVKNLTFDGTNALEEMLKQAGDEAERETTAYWQRVVSEGLYTKEGWSDGAIRDASK